MSLRAMTICAEAGCNERVRGVRCPKHQRTYTRDDNRPSSTARGYDKQWTRVRNAYLAQHPLCEDCHSKGIITAAREVHHKIRIAVDRSKRLDADNLMSLCRACHARRTMRGE